MIGKPKFKEGDLVSFTLGEKPVTGKVFVVDKWGIWMDHSDVYYDIMDEKANMLYKHVEEKSLKKEKTI
jgi:hypothetical protein